MKPVRLPAAATLALPRWGLFALGLLYILPGLIGRDPWKNDDAASFGVMWTMAHGSLSDLLAPNIAGLSMPDEGPLAFWVGALCIKLFGWLLGDVLAARISTVAFFLLGANAVWYAAFHLGRRPDAQPLRLAFGGQPEPNDYGRTLADTALLIYLGCLGLLSHSHENIAETLQISLLALVLYRTVRYIEGPSLRNAALIGLALGGMALTRSLVAPAAIWAALLAGSQLLGLPLRRSARHLGVSALVALAVVALWIAPAQLVQPFNSNPLDAWLAANARELALPGWASLKYFFRVGIWFFWPAWPFAAWAVYAWRRQHLVLHIIVPLLLVATLFLLSLFNPEPDQSDLMLLLPPLAVMAAFGLPTMKRGAINAIDWFSVMALTTGAVVIWLLWIAKFTGWPAQLAKNVLKLVPGYAPQVNLLALLVALAASAGWIALVHWRVSRQPAVLWRAVVLSSGGLILIWVLLMTLFLPEFNYSKSYASVARQAAAQIPAGARCVDTNVGPAQRASFAYFGALPFAAAKAPKCELLLLQLSLKAKDEAKALDRFGAGRWVQVWEGRRAADRDERFRLYRRAE